MVSGFWLLVIGTSVLGVIIGVYQKAVRPWAQNILPVFAERKSLPDDDENFRVLVTSTADAAGLRKS